MSPHATLLRSAIGLPPSVPFLLFLLLALAFPGCAPSTPTLTRFEYARLSMGVRTTITLFAPDSAHAEQAAAAAFDRIADLDQCMSDYRSTSELMRLCAAPTNTWVPVSPDLFSILQTSREIAERSGGAFDITTGPAVALWRRARTTRTLPPDHELVSARALIDWRSVESQYTPGMSEHTPGMSESSSESRGLVRLTRQGARLDLGAIAKGYAAQQAVDLLISRGIPRCLVALSGDIVAGDPPPGESGWRIAIASEQSAIPLGTLLLSRAAISTSGDTEQFIQINNQRYSHILDPRTALGIEGRRSVTILSPRGELADALATAACILGPEASRPLLAHYNHTAAIIEQRTDSLAPAERFTIDPHRILRRFTPPSEPRDP